MSAKPASKAGPVAAGVVLIVGALVLGSDDVNDILNRWEPARGDAQFVVHPDKLANNLPTVCDGITHHVATVPVIVGERWSPEKCRQQKRQAVLRVQRQLLACFDRAPPQSVFDAATSHAWNFGAGRTCKSGAMQAFNNGEWRKGCYRLGYADSGRRIWSSAGGKFVRGLAYRRDDEIKLCLRDVK